MERSLTLLNATDLTAWANRRDSQGHLPQLLRRLVHATTTDATHVEFRAGDGVAIGGWDGIVESVAGNAFVPPGESGWESGADKSIKHKADGDYEKRTVDPSPLTPSTATFVFVTPRRWGGKAKWVMEKQKEGVWREVRAYDADDLETWMEQTPGVHIWLSIFLGKCPEDASDLESFWEDWSEATTPPTPARFLLSGRQEAVETIYKSLGEQQNLLELESQSREEALAVFAAAIHELPEASRTQLLSRTVVVRSLAAWNQLASTAAPLIMILGFQAGSEIAARALRNGHRVVIPAGRSETMPDKAIVVPRLASKEAAAVLVAGGVGEEKADHLAALARKSLMSYRRQIAMSSALQEPPWAKPSTAQELIPALLAGAWSVDKDGDRAVLAELAAKPYEDVTKTMVRWANEPDAPVRYVGETWFLVSKEDAWRLLARYITRSDVERFGRVAQDILASPDPVLALPDNERWMAGVKGLVAPTSTHLRRGIAETLAVMGARGDHTPVGDSWLLSSHAGHFVREVLERANKNWRIWASLSRVLPLLAEAAPEVMLTALDQGASGDDPVLQHLFVDQSDPLFSSAHHSGLLWALETLSWNPGYLGRAASVLCKLAKLDPGGTWANRPPRTFRNIFLPWYPQTSANREQRFRVLKTTLASHPDVCYQLLTGLLPSGSEMCEDTARPRWRDWAPDEPAPLLRSDYIATTNEITHLLIDAAMGIGQRWSDLIEVYPNLFMEGQDRIVKRLGSLSTEELQDADRAAIWNAIRVQLSFLRSYHDDHEATRMEAEELQSVFDRFRPRDLLKRNVWLFSTQPQLPEGEHKDWHSRQKAIDAARRDAIVNIHAAGGDAGLLELVDRAEDPHAVGGAVGQSALLEESEEQLLQGHLASGLPCRARFASGSVHGRCVSRGRRWADQKFKTLGDKWSPSQRAAFLACLPTDSATWDLVNAADAETKRQYWRACNPYFVVSDDDSATCTVARELVDHGRPFAAVEVLATHVMANRSVPSELAVQALEACLRTSVDEDRPQQGFSHELSELLDFLEKASEVEDARLAALEWAFLSLLSHKRLPQLLHRELGRNPGFFVEIVATVYRAEGEETIDASEEAQRRARHAYELLMSWRTVPGSGEDGTIDSAALECWIQRSRELLVSNGRGEIGDHVIGEVLSGAPGDPDGAWPHAAVRQIIECVQCPRLERGLRLGILNSRGAVSRGLYTGGKGERELADKYSGWAAAIADTAPRTASVLRSVAECYRADGVDEDHRAELRQDLSD